MNLKNRLGYGKKKTKNSKLDETAIAVVKVCQSGQWHVENIIHGRWELAETARKIFEVVRDYRPIATGIEKGIARQAVVSPLTDLMKAAITKVTGTVPTLSTSGGTSDARFITHLCPVAEFGLVGQTMHKIDEHVSIDDIDQLTVIYLAMLSRFFEVMR